MTEPGALAGRVSAARQALDAHVREILAWHFDPATGCPFWLERAASLDFDPRDRIRGYADLEVLGLFRDEWLARRPGASLGPPGLRRRARLRLRDRRLHRRAQEPHQHPRLPGRLRRVPPRACPRRVSQGAGTG